MTAFDFFMDEDTRSKRAGILCLHKDLTAALTQSLFRIREKANSFHALRINALNATDAEKKFEVRRLQKQIREIKWSSLNLMRSFIAIEFLKTYFGYCSERTLPIIFFNIPFIVNHEKSINNFFQQLPNLKIAQLKNLNNLESVLFSDSFTTLSAYNFEEKVVTQNGLSRCYRIDSRAHDLIQLTDLLLGLIVSSRNKNNSLITNKSKLRVIEEFEKHARQHCIHYIN